MAYDGELTQDQVDFLHEKARETRKRWLEDLEGKCHQLWLLNGGETDKWNGMGCDCPWVQGNLVCKRMEFTDGL